jgi:serine/threonine protein kinase
MRSRRASKVHEFGSVQRNTKPDNILMAPAGFVAATNDVAKIGAKKANKKTSLRGNPMYVSPEIVKNSVSKKHHLIFGGHLAVQCLRC